MLIQELTRQECLDLLVRARLGRIACAQGNQPYVVPLFFAFDNDCLYGFATIGQRIQWMRANPLVCVEMDEIATFEQWISVIVFGRYEELPDTSEFREARITAYNRLHNHAMWWEPGYAPTVLQGAERPLEPIFYRIHITRISGHRASP